jgi:hypothetical protein
MRRVRGMTQASTLIALGCKTLVAEAACGYNKNISTLAEANPEWENLVYSWAFLKKEKIHCAESTPPLRVVSWKTASIFIAVPFVVFVVSAWSILGDLVISCFTKLSS